ncbi:hypothetical protein P168DRAFT_316110 [Aspergillus campestris IBT 28561]|uniref:Uncharacterized protein n=1 Tax=Aspergillus campestris (strain IBT 28561) TaxID=1392248 RepID=A0A2I1DCP1_ASPC2|nr:uncharacterized protein P168DRAFT_316110 [Aspergillus campestris IBT 28561]PKY07620.1 hypothetical protein P168DRAFT_316110 [Aspergillus campestris IBT 28561]
MESSIDRRASPDGISSLYPSIPGRYELAEHPATSARQSNHHRSYNGSDSSQASNKSQEACEQAYPLRRYTTRAVVLVTVPPLLTAYFILINWVYMVPDPDMSKYGHRNGELVFYSWWILGVFGLGLSKYGLAGVEAAMLHDRFWHADNTTSLMMHSEHSWSGFGGWIRCLNILIRRRKIPAQRLWWLLSLITLAVTIALPLSGLSMELFDGYVQLSAHPLMMGYFPESYNNRTEHQPTDRGFVVWQSGAGVNLPGVGIAYTAPGVDRSEYGYLEEYPNSMSVEQEVPDLFLTPQAESPVSGIIWGLRLSYNCSIVHNASELTILPRKGQFHAVNSDAASTRLESGLVPGKTEWIDVYNTTMKNLLAYVEFGNGGNTTRDNYLDVERFAGDGTISDPEILEIVVWQMLVQEPSMRSVPLKIFNREIAHPVAGLGSPITENHHANESFLAIEPKERTSPLNRHLDLSKIIEVASPIGVRCQSASTLGSARVDPSDSSFHNFTRIPPVPGDYSEGNVRLRTEPFGYGPVDFLRPMNDHPNVFHNLLQSVNSYPQKVLRNASFYDQYFQSEQLLSSAMRAYAVDALQVMYDGIYTFNNTRLGENLTASRPGKVLGPGDLPPHAPAVLFGVWATGCVLLGLWYGFRLRWAETLNGYSFLRFEPSLPR